MSIALQRISQGAFESALNHRPLFIIKNDLNYQKLYRNGIELNEIKIRSSFRCTAHQVTFTQVGYKKFSR